jgi:hypothetical protein
MPRAHKARSNDANQYAAEGPHRSEAIKEIDEVSKHRAADDGGRIGPVVAVPGSAARASGSATADRFGCFRTGGPAGMVGSGGSPATGGRFEGAARATSGRSH